MTDYSKISSQSMKELTDKVIRADLASRKIRMMNFKANRLLMYVWFPISLYTLYHMISPTGRLKSLSAQAGTTSLWKMTLGQSSGSYRLLYRPEIYYQEKHLEMKTHAMLVEKEVAGQENLRFKPYVWH